MTEHAPSHQCELHPDAPMIPEAIGFDHDQDGPPVFVKVMHRCTICGGLW